MGKVDKKVLIIADSMAMPSENVKYEDTWIFKVKESFKNIHFIDRSRRGTTTDRLIQEGGGYKNVKGGADLLEYYKPDIVIIQLGLVDCSPRLVNRDALCIKIINRLPIFLKNRYYLLKKRYSYRKPENAYVSINQFYSNYENFIQRARNLKTNIIGITIAPVAENFIEKSPYIIDSITKYNHALSKLEVNENFKLINPFKDPQLSNLFVDEMHFNAYGNDLIFNALKKELCQI
jgi:lysophospholipase L1-like esterase